MERPRIHIDMFKPNEAGIYSSQVSELGRTIFGEEMPVLTDLIRREVYKKGNSRWDIDVLKARVDEYALERLAPCFGTTDSAHTMDSYLKQLKHANATIDYIHAIAFPDDRQPNSLLSELTSVSDRPSDALWWLGRAEKYLGSEKVDVRKHGQILQFETTRQLLLAGISAGIHSRARDRRLHTTMTSIKQALDDGFYEPSGPVEKDVYSIHEDETNRTASVSFEEPKITQPGFYVKRRLHSLRKIPRVGRVEVDDSKKGDPAAILKVIAKAGKNGGWVNIDDVEDTTRMSYIVVEPDENEKRTEELIGKYLDYMLSYRISRQMVLGKLVGFIPDEYRERDRNKSSHFGGSRFQAIIEGASGEQIRFEVLFQTATQGWDALYMTGEKSSETGLYDGAAHKVYEIQRIIDILPILYPESIYGTGPMEAAHRRLEATVAQLRRNDKFDRIAA